ncbi:heavy-metal-associated domain-containing protein [Candidatus Wolfebacteria bacterium]|nr:heavy-metal-associated domain-containing protein [Candidatus Wolfebacteria bacterium]
MKHKLFLKTDCVGCMACLGFFEETVKQISGVSDAKLDTDTGEVFIDCEKGLNQEKLIKAVEEKTGLKLEIK